MGKDSASPPAAPNYTAAAQAQGTANLDAARLQAQLNNPNIVTPYGSQTVTWGGQGGAGSTFDQAGYDQAMQQYQAALANPGQGAFQGYEYVLGSDEPQRAIYAPAPTPTAPDRNAFMRSGPATGAPTSQDQATITQTLTPQAQQTLDAQLRTQTALANLGFQGTSTAQSVLGTPFSFRGPGVQTSLLNVGPVDTGPSADGYEQSVRMAWSPNITMGPFAGDYGSAGSVDGAQFKTNGYGQAQGFNANPYQTGAGPSASGFGATPYQTGANDYGMASGFGATPYRSGAGGVAGGMGADRYGLASGGVNDPSLTGNIDTSGIAQMPVNAGTTAQNAIMSRLDPSLAKQRTATETQLINQGLRPGTEAYNNAINLLGQQENDARIQAALQGLNLDMSANAQGFNQQSQRAQFGNTTALQGFNAALQNQQAANQAIAQNYGQGLSSAQLANQAIGQNFNQNLSSNAQNFNQGLASAQLQNQAIDQNFNRGLNANNQNFNQGVTSAQLGNQAIAQNFNQGLQSNNQNFNQGLAANQATNQAIGQNFNQGLNANNQNFNQALSAQQLANAAVGQNFNQGLSASQAWNAAQGQQYNQNLQNLQMQNTAAQQNFNNQLAVSQARNAALGQQFNQNLQGAQFANTAQQQALAQALQQRQMPLNEITALMSGSQIQNPTFQPYQGSNVAAAPIMQAAMANGQAGMNLYNAQQGANNATMSGLFGLGGAGLQMYGLMNAAGPAALAASDRSVKQKIFRIGTHPLGVGIYEFEYLPDIAAQWGYGRRVGVMADEVEKVLPEAVMLHEDGYKVVNYSMIH